MGDNIEKKTTTQVNWSNDINGNITAQRNLLVILNAILLIVIIIALVWIQIIKSNSKIEPFVIEIDKKTGIATIVDPVTVKEYSANTAIKRSNIIQYVRAREGYDFQTFDYNFNNVVRVFSDYSEYYKYKLQYNKNNPNSPYNILGKNGSIDVHWKSIIFINDTTAQIRINTEMRSGQGIAVGTTKLDKVIWMTFSFKDSAELNEEDRLINPLGFTITTYKITDENPNF